MALSPILVATRQEPEPAVGADWSVAANSSASFWALAAISLAKHRWATLARVPVQRTGRFTFSTRVGGRGRYRYRVFYGGDTSHIASRATFTVSVV